ncbi:MAG: hypothetical protein AAF610_09075 [Pseudomonadota bacterium]
MAIVIVGSMIIPAPPGVDPSNMDSVAANIDKFGPEQFVFPLLAHAVGTLAGAVVAILLARDQRRAVAFTVGVVFLALGFVATQMIPAPLLFSVTDLVVAYLPMAALALFLVKPVKKPQSQ